MKLKQLFINRIFEFFAAIWTYLLDALQNMSCLPIRGMKSDNSKISEIYHERQYFELCALHALNNVFQDPNAFNKEQLDEICSRYVLLSVPTYHAITVDRVP